MPNSIPVEIIDEILKENKKEDPKQTQSLYEKLSVPVPKEYLVDYIEDGKVFKGYNAQYAINLLNEVVGLGDWNTDEEILKQETLKRGWSVAMKIAIIFRNESLSSITGYGGAFAKNIANAYKGAKTSAFKNACKYLGIGQELYLQTVDEEVLVIEPSETVIETPEESNDLANEIDIADSLEKLEQLKEVVEQVEGEAVKKVLIKKYNARKIFLIDSSKK